MRVLFDAYWARSGPPSGRMVVTETVRAWNKEFPDDELIALVKTGEASPRLPAAVSILETRLRPHALAVSTLSRLAKKTSADAVITQNFAVRSRNSSVFLHDAIFQSNPEFFTKAERTYFRLITASLPNANNVFTSSQTEAARIVRQNIGLDVVHPVGLAMGQGLLAAASVRPAALGIVDGFVLAVGRLNVRKNLAAVFDAVTHSNRFSPTFPLLVVGERDGKTSSLSQEVKNMIDCGQIRFLGGVPDSQLRWLYENASAMVFPSLDEGYGLPPLEAAYFGCPVLLSDIPVFRELYSGIATFVDPRKPLDISEKLDMVLASGKEALMKRELPDASWSAVVGSMRRTMVENWAAE